MLSLHKIIDNGNHNIIPCCFFILELELKYVCVQFAMQMILELVKYIE